MDGRSSIVTARSTANTRAYRSHSEAERKHRQRINGHPSHDDPPAATRMDKATLLREVVRHTRELHESANDVALVVPTERDEVHVEEEEEGRTRAWVCCSDRPGPMTELNRVITLVRAKSVRVEIATIDGRTMSTLELEFETEGHSALIVALRSVLANNGPDSIDSLGNYKRQCLTKRAWE